jgi:hypothetical protein
VDPVREAIVQGLYSRVSLDQIVRWDVILGIQSETLVLGNLTTLLQRIGLDASQVRSAAPYFQRRTNRQEACQIDLLIQTKHALYVCEVKCRARIERSIIDEVVRKIAALRVYRGLTVRPVLIFEGILDPSIPREAFFDELVSFQDLLS